MELEFERGDDPEVAASAPETPEQVGVLLLARHHELAVGGDHVARAQVVDRQPELAHQVADAATQGQSGDAGVADDPAGDGEPEDLALAVDVVVEATSFDADGLSQWVDARPSHERQVDHDAVVAEGVTRDGVPSAPHGGEQIVLAGEADGGDHVGDTATPGDQRRSAVDVPVPDLANVVVLRVTGSNQVAEEVGLERVHGGGVECGHGLPFLWSYQACRTTATGANTGRRYKGVVRERSEAFCTMYRTLGPKASILGLSAPPATYRA